MTSGTYAVVAYLNGSLADFVQKLRARLDPREGQIRPHLTLLSPRVLEVPPEKLRSALQRICYPLRPVQVSLGEVESFVPATSTVYLGVDESAGKVRELHQRLNQYGFRAEESWPYVPHVTLAKLADDAAALAAAAEAQRQWPLYRGTREFLIDRLTLVREIAPECWADLAVVALAAPEGEAAHESTCPESGQS